ncbi:MAG: tetratricopeptide repeat protein [candidate division KSB1 bacterium]|nr:tetratricopeptide repeat protein [candidate division KSB1 bacterium]
MSRWKRANVLFFLLPLIAACTRPPHRQSAFDPAASEAAYQQGIEFLQQEDHRNAAIAFQRALKANPNHAEALAGLAYLSALRGEGEKAVEAVEKAAAKNNRSIDVQMMRGKVYLLVKPNRWADRAAAAFDAVLAASPDNQEARFYRAEIFFQQGDYAKASDGFRAIREGRFAETARERLRFISARIAASPRTPYGEALLQKEALTRADLAVLLIQELGIDRLIARRNPNPARSTTQATSNVPIVDITGLKEQLEIRKIVGLGVMSVYPDHCFRPFEVVTRMDAALIFQQALILITGDRALDTAYLNSGKRFIDVKPSHYGYNAVCLMTERGIMSSSEDAFAPNRPLSGIEALTAVRKLEGF